MIWDQNRRKGGKFCGKGSSELSNACCRVGNLNDDQRAVLEALARAADGGAATNAVRSTMPRKPGTREGPRPDDGNDDIDALGKSFW